MDESNLLQLNGLSDDGDDRLHEYQQEYLLHAQLWQQEYNEEEDEDYVVDEEHEMNNDEDDDDDDDEDEDGGEEEEETEEEKKEAGDKTLASPNHQRPTNDVVAVGPNHHSDSKLKKYVEERSINEEEVEEEDDEDEDEEDYEEDLELLDDAEDELQDLYEYEKYYNNPNYRNFLEQHTRQQKQMQQQQQLQQRSHHLPDNIDQQLIQEELQKTPQSNQQQIRSQQVLIAEHNRKNLTAELETLNKQSISTVHLSDNDDDDDGDYEEDDTAENDDDDADGQDDREMDDSAAQRDFVGHHPKAQHENLEGYTSLPEPCSVVLNDGETMATLYPIFPANPGYLPQTLVSFLLDEFNMEIEKGETLPFYDQLTLNEFKNEWFTSSQKIAKNPLEKFNPHEGMVCVMILGEIKDLEITKIKSGISKSKKLNNIQWEKQCLGAFNIKPAFPGRSSHICTSTFLVNAGIRGKGIGRIMVEVFLDWAPRLGFSLAQFPLIYETNVGIRKIFESLDFQQIGHLPNSGILKGYDTPIGSVFYYKDLMLLDENREANNLIVNSTTLHNVQDSMQEHRLGFKTKTGNNQTYQTDNLRIHDTGKEKTLLSKKKIPVLDSSGKNTATTFATSSSFANPAVALPARTWSKDIDAEGNMEKYTRIAYFLTTGSYPPAIDRQEKAKLRASRSRYQVDEEGRLYMNGKEVIYNMQHQLDLVKKIHALKHVGINKLTRLVNKDYYWPGIKNAVTDVIKNCAHCKNDIKKTVKQKRATGRIVKTGKAPTQIYMGHSIPIKRLHSRNVPAQAAKHNHSLVGNQNGHIHQSSTNPYLAAAISSLHSMTNDPADRKEKTTSISEQMQQNHRVPKFPKSYEAENDASNVFSSNTGNVEY